MVSRSRLIPIIVVLAFAGFLAWTTLSAQKVTCEICVDYHGRSNCATASAASEEEAVTSAQNTACGPVASGMNESIECGRIPPSTRQCRTS
ncbi:MAG: hypothetical protein SGI84_14180 [Gemmatimonadota bacterium]|nr:hypothetical protein [Gemmatimonadota bacterium]